jgi:hypothetical protein
MKNHEAQKNKETKLFAGLYRQSLLRRTKTQPIELQRATYAGGIDFLESIPGLFRRLQIWAQIKPLRNERELLFIINLKVLSNGTGGGGVSGINQ